MNFLRTKFISPEGEKHLLAYKYVGSDASLIYKYILSPFAQWCVDHIIPEWMAPNLITLIGFSCNLISHIWVLVLFGNNIFGAIPAWLLIFAAVMHICYMNLDNIDGKQARKTGNSSPLGLLFDHGCDAMNTWVAALIFLTCVQMGNNMYSIFSYVLLMIPFYTATWEEYYVEGLHLPIVNGANEGSLVAPALYLVTAIIGPNVWLENHLGIQNNLIIFWVFVGMAALTLSTNIYNVWKHDSSKLQSAFYNLVSMGYICFTMAFVGYFSYTNIVSYMPRTYIYFFGFTFSKLVGHLQADHVAGEKFNQFRKSIIFSLTFLNINTILGHFNNGKNLNEEYTMYALLIYAAVVYFHFAINVIDQFTTVLGIRCFKVKPKVQKQVATNAGDGNDKSITLLTA